MDQFDSFFSWPYCLFTIISPEAVVIAGAGIVGLTHGPKPWLHGQRRHTVELIAEVTGQPIERLEIPA